MDALVVSLLLILSMAAHSDATYCVCNNGVDEHTLQKNIDYACGTGADCSAIHDGGACFNPNTIRDHCNFAVNSYYQRKQQVNGSCDFERTATITSSPPSAASGCVYQASPRCHGIKWTGCSGAGLLFTDQCYHIESSGGSTIPGTNSTTGGIPNMGGGTLPGTGFGLGPSGSGLGGTDSNAGMTQLPLTSTFMLVSFSSLTFLIYGFMWPTI